ncbi:hypothetical protein [Fibrella forsythiae]|uniref:Uncharacterized protein n=1 Tax=Fibrella forsythiae TaxID=2817061 RepID=A0ABS3JBH0_9BACT|nr:hypothetical protein [Fibrella forsythiae]MBO0947335.1 hypothetical protein [Fibrella forsythiae]
MNTNMQFKLFLFWLGATWFSYAVARLHFLYGDIGLNWKWFQRQVWTGAIYSICRDAGLIIIGIYLIYHIAVWYWAVLNRVL